MLIGHLYIFFGKMTIQILCLFLIEVFILSLHYCIVSIIYIFYIQVVYQTYDLQIFSFFLLPWWGLLKCKIFNFDESNLSVFYFVVYDFGVISKKPLLDQRLWRFSPIFSSVSCTILTHLFKYLIHINFFYIMCIGVQLHSSSARGYTAILLLTEKIIISQLNWHGILVEKSIDYKCESLFLDF